MVRPLHVEKLWRRPRYTMLFRSGNSAIVTVTGTAADLDFPSVVISGLPPGAIIERVIASCFIAQGFDTSGSENQMSVADGAIRVKSSGAAWGTGDIKAIDVAQNDLETAASAYRGGAYLSGANNDIKAVVNADGTYNFRSEETNRGDAIAATGGNLELQGVVMMIEVTFY